MLLASTSRASPQVLFRVSDLTSVCVIRIDPVKHFPGGIQHFCPFIFCSLLKVLSFATRRKKKEERKEEKRRKRRKEKRKKKKKMKKKRNKKKEKKEDKKEQEEKEAKKEKKGEKEEKEVVSYLLIFNMHTEV